MRPGGSMKTEIKRCPVWMLVALLVLLSSCVEDRPLLKDRENKLPATPSAMQLKDATRNDDKIIKEDGKVFKLTSTPFGYVKEQAVAPEISPTVSPSAAEKEVAAEIDHKSSAEPEPDKSVSIPKKEAQVKAPKVRLKTPAFSQKDNSEIVLNFDDADIYEVIRMVADLLKINYIVNPNVHGKVTIHTAGKLKKIELLPVFYQILEANGLTAVKEGSLYKIVEQKEASRLPIASRIGREQKTISPADRVIIQIIPLRFISSKEMSKLLTPFVSSQGVILSHDDSNTLVVVDKGINILKILRMVDAFDVDVFGKVRYNFFPLKNMDAEEAVKVLDSVFSVKKNGKSELKFVGIDRLNMVLGVSTVPGVFGKVEILIKRLDMPSDLSEPRIYVYFVKNGEAKELAEILNEVFSTKSSGERSKFGEESKASSRSTQRSLGMGNPYAMKQRRSEKGREKKEARVLEPFLGTLRSQMRITADEVRNALIIQAIPSDYRVIEGILNKIDVLPRQVLIELMIAEITLDSAHQMGIEWNYVKGPGSPSTALLSASAGVSGLQYVIGETDRWTAALTALASENKVDVLSSPSILASDNKEATINISTEVPVASAQYQYTAGTEPLLQTNIQYRNTGLILSVTPHVNDRGLVTMVIKQEVSDLSQNVQVGSETYPSFFKRSVDTTLTVAHGQTIVIGGLIKETKSNGISGIPGLIHIPILRYIFGKKTSSISKSELIILITPHVIRNLGDVDAVTREFKSKVNDLFN